MTAKKSSRGEADRENVWQQPDSDADETNLGALLKAALAAQQVPAIVQEPEKAEKVGLRNEETRPQEERKLQRCADCWNAIVFKDERGRLMARCAKNLWMRPSYTYEDLNTDKVRRWHADCPEFDDSE